MDYGMDPDIVNSPIWGPQLQAALKAIPTVSIVTDLPNLFDPTTGILYSVDGGGHLFTINKSNGACTTVGDLSAGDYSAMAFNSAGELFLWNTFTNNLLKVNKSNAAVVSGELPTRVRHGKVRYQQLPRWQEKSLSRLPDLYPADSVPNAQKSNEICD